MLPLLDYLRYTIKFSVVLNVNDNLFHLLKKKSSKVHFLTAARTFKIKSPFKFCTLFFSIICAKNSYEKAFIKLDELKLSGTFSWLLLKYHFISDICVGKILRNVYFAF